MTQSRQLAAIMFTDIVGYTSLMGKDEQKAFDLLKKNRELQKPIIEHFDGRWIKELGDGVMASFNTVSDAINAAIKIQENCTAANDFQLRIGIHQGEVVFEAGDVFGDAVNIASRIQTLAMPGSILFSQKVQEELKNKPGFRMASLGIFEFKNVAKPMEVFALTNEGFPVPHRKNMEGKLKTANARPKIRFAVLLLIILAIAALFVYKFYFSEVDINKDYRKKITANPKAYEWYMKAEYRLTPENKYDVDSCIFFLKKAIDADSVFALAHAELSRAYSIKNYWLDTEGGYSEKAFVEAEKSLYLKPDLAEGYFAKAYCTWNFQNKFPHEKTILEFKKAIALKPDMDEAYHQLGVVYLHVGLMDEIFAAYRKAIQINADNKFAVLDLASAYFYTGKKADLEQMINLFKETPEHLISPFRTANWAIALITLDRSVEAKDILSEGLKMESSDLFLNSAFAILLAKEGDKAGALKKIEFCEKSNLNTGHFHHAVYNLAVSYALLGNYQKSVSLLTWVSENGFPNYPFFRDDPLLKSLQQFTPYQELLEKLKITWNKFRQIANE